MPYPSCMSSWRSGRRTSATPSERRGSDRDGLLPERGPVLTQGRKVHLQCHVRDVHRVESEHPQIRRNLGRQVRVDEQPHAGRATGTSRSLTAAAPNFERSKDVVPLEVWVILEHLVDAPSGRKLTENHPDGDARIPDGGKAPHPGGIDGDAVRRHRGKSKTGPLGRTRLRNAIRGELTSGPWSATAPDEKLGRSGRGAGRDDVGR
jgi:hypothetical protein